MHNTFLKDDGAQTLNPRRVTRAGRFKHAGVWCVHPVHLRKLRSFSSDRMRWLALRAGRCWARSGARWGTPAWGAPRHGDTFLAQATFALPVPGAPGRFLLMADRWNQERLGLSRRALLAGRAW